MTLAPLAGFTVGITADRRREEQAALLRRWGARVLCGPVMRTEPVSPDAGLRRATEQVVTRPPDIVVANTGIGIRGWLSAAEAWGCADQLAAALRGARIVARGPKAAGALEAADLPVWRREPTERLRALVSQLISEGAVRGARVAVQLDGGDRAPELDRLEAAGADTVVIPVYRWTAPFDDQPARRLIEQTCAGGVDAVTFTSPPAVRLFHELATRAGLAASLAHALESVVVACVGPATADEARAQGVPAPVAPGRGRLGLLVRMVVERLESRAVHVQLDKGLLVMQGAAVAWRGVHVQLPPRERRLLQALAAAPGSVVPRARLTHQVWGSEHSSHALDAAVGRLRRRLEPIGLEVVAHPKRGYRLTACPAAATG